MSEEGRMTPVEPNIFYSLGQALKRFPEYLIGYIFGFIVVTINDVTMTSLALGCVALGFVVNPITAAAVYLLFFVFLKSVNTVANAIGSSGQNLTNSLNQWINLATKDDPPT